MRRFVEWRREAHPFFWVVGAMLVPAVIAAASAPPRAPAYALGSAWLYRLEVAGACFLGLTVIVHVLWLAYSGRSLGSVQLPGVGVGLRDPDPELDAAARDLFEHVESTNRRLEMLEENIEHLVRRDDTRP